MAAVRVEFYVPFNDEGFWYSVVKTIDLPECPRDGDVFVVCDLNRNPLLGGEVTMRHWTLTGSVLSGHIEVYDRDTTGDAVAVAIERLCDDGWIITKGTRKPGK